MPLVMETAIYLRMSCLKAVACGILPDSLHLRRTPSHLALVCPQFTTYHLQSSSPAVSAAWWVFFCHPCFGGCYYTLLCALGSEKQEWHPYAVLQLSWVCVVLSTPCTSYQLEVYA